MSTGMNSGATILRLLTVTRPFVCMWRADTYVECDGRRLLVDVAVGSLAFVASWARLWDRRGRAVLADLKQQRIGGSIIDPDLDGIGWELVCRTSRAIAYEKPRKLHIEGPGKPDDSSDVKRGR